MGTDAKDAQDALEARLRGRLGAGPAAEWLAERRTVADLDAARALMPEVPRAVGRRPLVAAFAERAGATLPGVWGPVPIGGWRVDGAVRALLLARAAAAAADPYDALFRAYDLGDTDTRVAALRALNLCQGEVERGLELVLDAGRTYLTPLLEAAWAGNPFSAEHLSPHDYRKAVLKAFFCDVPVDGFLRLDERADAELAASLCDYIDERLAAGRSVPRALWAVVALHPRPGLVARLIGNLEHPDREERLAAARALARARDGRALPFIVERLAREDDAEVGAALDAARAATEA